MGAKMEFRDPKMEGMSRDELRQVQLERLQSTLHRVYKNVRHYRKLFREMDFMPEDLVSVDDLTRLPFVTRRNLIENYPYDMFAVPLREVVRLHAPIPRRDEPVVMGFTRNDLANWAELLARNLVAVGLDKDDVIQVSPSFGIMTGSFGVQMGAERIGASVIPMTGGQFSAKVRIMRDFRTTALVSTPTFALGLLNTMIEADEDVQALNLRHAILGSEPWSEDERRRLEEGLHVTATDTYGLSEVFGPGVAWECPEKKGLHIPEDHFIPEIIDPVTLAPLKPGEFGELVLTTITKEAFPLIRFRTGDLTRLTYEPCACGRTHCRMDRVSRRCDEAAVLRGMRIVPDQVGQVLREMAGGDPAYQLVVEREKDLDQVTVLVEITDTMFFDEMRRQRRFMEDLNRGVSEALGWDVAVRLVEPGLIEREKKIDDRRRF